MSADDRLEDYSTLIAKWVMNKKGIYTETKLT